MPKVNKVGSSRALSKTAGFSSVPKANAVENGRQDVSNPPRSSVAEHPPSDDDADADADAKAVVGGEKTSRGQQKRQARREQEEKKAFHSRTVEKARDFGKRRRVGRDSTTIVSVSATAGLALPSESG